MLLGNILLSCAWAALLGEFSLGNLVTGYALGYIILAVLARGGVVPSRYRNRVHAVFALALFLLKEFLVANVRMAIDVLRPRMNVSPGIVRVPLDATDEYEILLLSTLVNLTPGSIAVDLSPDRKVLYVHMMHVSSPDEARATIKYGFERRVMSVLQRDAE